MSLADMRLRRDLKSDPIYRKLYIQNYAEKAKEDAKEQTKKLFENRIKRRNMWRRKYNTIVTSESQFQENLVTNDTSDITGNATTPIPADSGVHHVLSLDDFFSRPVMIDSFSITPGTVPNNIIEPFEAWSSDPTVRAKLSHYAFLRGDLKVRITTSSTRFHFGSMMVSFQPYFETNYMLQSLFGLTTDNPNAGGLLINYLSQSPERHVLKFGKDNTIEMTLPMILPTRTAKLYNKDALVITNAIPFEDLGPLGSLVFRGINPLQVANDDEQSLVWVQTYAWFENVELGPSTATDINIVAESAPIDAVFTKVVEQRGSMNGSMVLKKAAEKVSDYVSDEYSDAGPTSKLASAASNFAAKFTDIPYLGQAARATSVALGAGAKILKFFGFSKPSLIDPLVFVKNLPFSNGALTEGKDTAYKLTSDPKQELSIQPLGGEFSIDPMAIKFITSRESYFTTFNWSETDLPRVDTLAAFPITPLLDSNFKIPGSVQRIHQLTSMYHAAIPFKYWRGTVSFRFEIVASAFHRGKLMFIYEPNSFGMELIDAATSDLNQQYIYYLDIEEDRDLTIHCGFVHNRLIANVHPLSSVDFAVSSHEYDYSVDSLPTYSEMALLNQSIGVLYVRALTALTSPSTNSDNDVKINCYAYSDDMEFSVPIDMSQLNVSRQITPGSLILSESNPEGLPDGGGLQKDIKSNTRTTSTSVLINKLRPSSENVFLYHIGEKIESFRSLLKRDETTTTLNITAITNQAVTTSVPIYPGTSRTGIPSYGSVDPNIVTSINFVNNRFSLFEHLRYSYLGCKGGYRYRVTQTNPLQYFGNISVNRVDLFGTLDQFIPATVNSTMISPTLAGGIMFNQNTNTGIEFEIPYFSNNLFELANKPFSLVDDLNNGLFTPETPGALLYFEHLNVSHDALTKFISSAAEDFTFFRFQGAGFYVVNQL